MEEIHRGAPNHFPWKRVGIPDSAGWAENKGRAKNGLEKSVQVKGCTLWNVKRALRHNVQKKNKNQGPKAWLKGGRLKSQRLPYI
jgi:hypothetical protein